MGPDPASVETPEEEDAGGAAPILDPGGDIDAKDSTGITLLHYWTRAGNAGVVRLLVEEGADLDARDNRGWSALHFAAAGGQLGLVELLLDAGADPKAREYSRNSRLRNRFIQKARFLRINGRGLTPAQRAREAGHSGVADFIDRWKRPARPQNLEKKSPRLH